MKPVYYFCFFGMLILLKTVVSDDNHPLYDYSYIQSEYIDGDRVITPGHNGWRQYGFIGADSDGCYNLNSNSWIILNVSSSYHITMRFMWIASDCPNDILQIKGETGEATTFCGFYTPSYSIYSSSNWLELRFTTDAYHSTCLGGFRLYYTSYHHGECSDNEFRCAFEGRCIPEELKCDSYDNCGDWSDERGGTCGLSTEETTTRLSATTYEPETTVLPPQPCSRSTAVYMNFDLEARAGEGQVSSLIIRRGGPDCIVVCATQCKATVDYCYQDPCQNSGTCVVLSNGYRCECTPGFTGTNCETELDCDGVTCSVLVSSSL